MLVKRQLGSLRQGTERKDVTKKGFQKHYTRDDTNKANQSSSIGLIMNCASARISRYLASGNRGFTSEVHGLETL